MTDQKPLTPEPQYIAVKFNEWDRRTYTYANPFDPVKVGDAIRVNVRGKIIAAVVHSITTEKPTFKCNQIEGETDA